MPVNDERLAAQIAFFSGDDHIRREAAPWKGRPFEERWAALTLLCEQAAKFAATWPEHIRERALQPVPLPADTIEILRRMFEEGQGGRSH